MFKGNWGKNVMLLFSLAIISSCGNAGSSVAEFQTVSVNVKEYSFGTVGSNGADVYPGNACTGTTETTASQDQTAETFSATLESKAYNGVANPLNVYLEGYTVTYEPTNNGPLIPPYEGDLRGTPIPSAGTAELSGNTLIDVARKNSVRSSIPPCSSSFYTYDVTVTFHMVEAQGIDRKTQPLVIGTKLLLRDVQ